MLDVIFQNTDFLVVDKPAGMNFHSEDGHPGMVVQLSEQLGNPVLYPVHRLDKMTSGLLLIALNKKTAQRFQVLFSERKIEKFYLAISDKKPKKKQGWVKGDMQPARNGSWKLMKSMQNPAVTQFICISVKPGERAFLLKLHSGKTHQLRVALKSLSAPICGDKRYAFSEDANGEQRGYLHSYALRFELYGEYFTFCHPPAEGQRFLSNEFKGVLAKWCKPWEFFKG